MTPREALARALADASSTMAPFDGLPADEQASLLREAQRLLDHLPPGWRLVAPSEATIPRERLMRIRDLLEDAVDLVPPFGGGGRR